MHSYEYIFTAIIVFAILAASIALVSTMPQPSINVLEIQQLKMTAQKIMTYLTLNPGNPADWGGNIKVGPKELTAFGLAKYMELVRSAYVLDPDKVQRLSSGGVPPSLHIPPSRVIELFNLGRDYGLKLEFIPALNVSVNAQLNNGEISVSLSVLSEQGKPIANADVAARVFYLQDGQVNKTSLASSRTRGDGGCTIIFNEVDSDAALIVLLVDYNGVCVAKTSILGSFAKSYFIGNNLILDNPFTIPGNAAYQVMAFKSGGRCLIDCVVCGLTQWSPSSLNNYNVYNMTYVEPYTAALLAVTGEGKLAVACRNVPSSYSSIPGETYPPLAYTLERSVIIGQSLYTLRLKVWRMTW
jgi:hypothetical protein